MTESEGERPAKVGASKQEESSGDSESSSSDSSSEAGAGGPADIIWLVNETNHVFHVAVVAKKQLEGVSLEGKLWKARCGTSVTNAHHCFRLKALRPSVTPCTRNGCRHVAGC